MIDTNILIEFLRGRQEIKQYLSKDNVFIPSIVIGELYYGAYGSGNKHNIKTRIEQINTLIQIIPVLEVGINTSEHYGKVKSYLKSNGTPIPENDVWIMAIALEHNLIVITEDKHFKQAEGLLQIEGL